MKDKKKNKKENIEEKFIEEEYFIKLPDGVGLPMFGIKNGALVYDQNYMDTFNVIGNSLANNPSHFYGTSPVLYPDIKNSINQFTGMMVNINYGYASNKLIDESFNLGIGAVKINEFSHLSSRVNNYALPSMIKEIGATFISPYCVDNNITTPSYLTFKGMNKPSNLLDGYLSGSLAISPNHNFAQTLTGLNNIMPSAVSSYLNKNGYVSPSYPDKMTQLAADKPLGGMYNLINANDCLSAFTKRTDYLTSYLPPKQTSTFQKAIDQSVGLNSLAFVSEVNNFSNNKWFNNVSTIDKNFTAFGDIQNSNSLLNTIINTSPNHFHISPTDYSSLGLYSNSSILKREIIIPKAKPSIDEERLCKMESRLKVVELQVQEILSKPNENNNKDEVVFLKEEVVKLRLELAAYEIKNSEMDDFVDSIGVMSLFNISERTFYRHRDDWTVHKIGSKRLYKKSEIILSIKKFLK